MKYNSEIKLFEKYEREKNLLVKGFKCKYKLNRAINKPGMILEISDNEIYNLNEYLDNPDNDLDID
jgi:hypothetical protein